MANTLYDLNTAAHPNYFEVVHGANNFPNSGICFIQHTAAIISVGIICWLAVIIYNPFIQRGYTNAYLFPRIKSL